MNQMSNLWTKSCPIFVDLVSVILFKEKFKIFQDFRMHECSNAQSHNIKFPRVSLVNYRPLHPLPLKENFVL